MNRNYLILAFLLFCSLSSARTYAAGGDVPPEVIALTDRLKQKYAPDGRVALFKTDYTFDGKPRLLRPLPRPNWWRPCRRPATK